MNRRIRFERLARKDLELVERDSEERFGAAQADRYLDGLRRTLERVAVFPEGWREVRQGLRMAPYEAHLVLYSVGMKEVAVERVIHAGRDLDKAMESRRARLRELVEEYGRPGRSPGQDREREDEPEA